MSKFVIDMTPEYTELLVHLQGRGRWLQWPKEMLAIRDNLKIHNYPELYDDEKKLGTALFFGLMGIDGFKEWNAEIAGLTHDEQVILVNEFVSFGDDIDISGFLPPESEVENQEALKQLEQLTAEEKQETIKRAQFFWSYVFAHFYNALSVMILGEKLTSLVPKAIAGDQEAFCKAIQIDKSIVTYHPHFVQRKQQALQNGETEFLAKIAYREQNPALRGKIRYPGLYMLFSILESLNWLDDLSHSEILDLCDEARLDRFQNRIEDVNYLTKRLREYRRMQKTGGLSMR